jgi:hypothetical protein
MGFERRAWVRYSSNQESFCHLIAAQMNNTCWLAKTQNISVSGVALLMDAPLERGMLVAIELEELSRPLLARVVQTTAHADRSWTAGCEFTSKLSDEEVHAFKNRR